MRTCIRVTYKRWLTGSVGTGNTKYSREDKHRDMGADDVQDLALIVVLYS